MAGKKRRKTIQPESRREEFEIRAPYAILLIAFLLPNLGALWCGFVLDDVPLLVDDARLHSLDSLGELWTTEYWPDRTGQTVYRPVTKTVWAFLWTIGGGAPIAFHALNLVLGSLVVMLLYRYLIVLKFTQMVAFVAALIFALFPIHTEVTTSIVGLGELLAATFGIGALLAHRAGYRVAAIALFAIAVFSKESAAALIAIGWLAADKPRRRYWWDAALAVATVAAVLFIRQMVSHGPSIVPPIDNPMSLQTHFQRVLTALWVQCLYLGRTVLPITLSADYSYKQIPLVMGLGDIRGWSGILLAGLAFGTALRKREYAAGVLAYAILFSPASNVLFPIGTMMGERLVYLPSAGIAMIGAIFLTERFRGRVLVTVLAMIVLGYGARTVARNLDWRNADSFYSSMVKTSPNSAKAHFSYGTMLASRGNDRNAVAEYDVAISIFPAYSEAYHNRGNALARLGRMEEAKESYRMVLRLDPLHQGAGQNLTMLEAGVRIAPARKHL